MSFRKYLTLTAVSSALALAGCGGEFDKDSSENKTGISSSSKSSVASSKTQSIYDPTKPFWWTNYQEVHVYPKVDPGDDLTTFSLMNDILGKDSFKIVGVEFSQLGDGSVITVENISCKPDELLAPGDFCDITASIVAGAGSLTGTTTMTVHYQTESGSALSQSIPVELFFIKNLDAYFIENFEPIEATVGQTTTRVLSLDLYFYDEIESQKMIIESITPSNGSPLKITDAQACIGLFESNTVCPLELSFTPTQESTGRNDISSIDFLSIKYTYRIGTSGYFINRTIKIPVPYRGVAAGKPLLNLVSASSDLNAFRNDDGTYPTVKTAVTIRNGAMSPVAAQNVTVSLDGIGTAPITTEEIDPATPCLTNPIAPGGQCTFNLVYSPAKDTPPTSGSFSVVVSADNADPVNTRINYRADTPSHLAFSGTQPDKISTAPNNPQSISFKIKNDGSSAANNISFKIDGVTNVPLSVVSGSANGLCEQTLASNQECSFQVLYSPTEVQQGNFTVTVTYDLATGQQQQLTTGQIFYEAKAPTPAAISFNGTVPTTISAPINQTNEISFEIKNTGESPAEGLNLSLSNPVGTGRFEIISTGPGSCGPTLANQGICSFKVKYTPQNKGETGTIQININYNGATTPLSSTLSYSTTPLEDANLGIPAGGAPDSLVADLNFSNSAFLTIENFGDKEASLLTASILNGPTGDQIAIVPGGTCSETLGAHSQCTFKIQYTPTVATTGNNFFKVQVGYKDTAGTQKSFETTDIAYSATALTPITLTTTATGGTPGTLTAINGIFTTECTVNNRTYPAGSTWTVDSVNTTRSFADADFTTCSPNMQIQSLTFTVAGGSSVSYTPTSAENLIPGSTYPTTAKLFQVASDTTPFNYLSVFIKKATAGNGYEVVYGSSQALATSTALGSASVQFTKPENAQIPAGGRFAGLLALNNGFLASPMNYTTSNPREPALISGTYSSSGTVGYNLESYAFYYKAGSIGTECYVNNVRTFCFATPGTSIVKGKDNEVLIGNYGGLTVGTPTGTTGNQYTFQKFPLKQGTTDLQTLALSYSADKVFIGLTGTPNKIAQWNRTVVDGKTVYAPAKKADNTTLLEYPLPSPGYMISELVQANNYLYVSSSASSSTDTTKRGIFRFNMDDITTGPTQLFTSANGYTSAIAPRVQDMAVDGSGNIFAAAAYSGLNNTGKTEAGLYVLAPLTEGTSYKITKFDGAALCGTLATGEACNVWSVAVDRNGTVYVTGTTGRMTSGTTTVNMFLAVGKIEIGADGTATAPAGFQIYNSANALSLNANLPSNGSTDSSPLRIRVNDKGVIFITTREDGVFTFGGY